MRASLLLLFLAVPVLAQGKRRKPVFEVPDKNDTSGTPARPEARDDALQNTIRRLAGWPSERSRRAAELLIVQKEKTNKLILEILISQRREHQALKPGAAYVLGRIGERLHTTTLILVAAEKPQHKHAAVFLDAAWRLDEHAAVAEAFRFFHLGEATLRRQAVKFVRLRVTRKNLPAVHDLLDMRKSDRAFTREIGLQLLDRLVAVGEVKWEEAGPYFYAKLGDSSPQVASRAMRLVASRKDQGNIDRLNGLITKEFSNWRQRSYAALALSIMSSAFKVQPFKPATIAFLRGERGIRHSKEMLAQAAAALALAQATLRSGDQELIRLLDREIPIVLIESVGAGNRHYRDFASVMPLAYTMLRRITGRTLPDQAPVWAKWWQDHGRNFRARRELIGIDPRDIADTVVEVTAPRESGGEARRFAVVGSSPPSFLHGRAYAVPPARMKELVDGVRASGFFDRPETDPARIEDSDALLVVRVGDLVRTVAYGVGPGTTAKRDRLLSHFDLLADEFTWQLWWDIAKQPSWELFFAENSRWFHENRGAKARAERQRAMVAASLDDLHGLDQRLFATRFVASLPGGGAALAKEQRAAFIKAVATEREASAFVDAVVDLFVPGTGEGTLLSLMDALADKVGPRAQAPLVRICQSLPAARVAALAADRRWKVRRAAVGALSQADPKISRPVLTERLKDDVLLVRVVAAEALARMKDPAILPALAGLRDDISAEVRGAAAYAYGLLAGREGREGIEPLLYEDSSPRVRIRAIEGLVESRDPDAADLLVRVFEIEADITVRAAAASGVVKLETPALVHRLIQRLEVTGPDSPERVALVNVLARFRSARTRDILLAALGGDDTLSRDAAALGLARRWDDAAISQLITMAKYGRNARAAVRHLQILCSRSFDAPSYKRQAENYAGWFRANSTGSPRLWFKEALTLRGYDASPLRGFCESKEDAAVVPDEGVPLLLRVLRDDDWYLQRNASMLLSRRMGKDAPDVISYLTTPQKSERAIRAYHDWWAAVEKKKEAERRG